jgi:hypothetical protein
VPGQCTDRANATKRLFPAVFDYLTRKSTTALRGWWGDFAQLAVGFPPRPMPAGPICHFGAPGGRARIVEKSNGAPSIRAKIARCRREKMALVTATRDPNGMPRAITVYRRRFSGQSRRRWAESPQPMGHFRPAGQADLPDEESADVARSNRHLRWGFSSTKMKWKADGASLAGK